jgi:hypothetical protein
MLEALARRGPDGSGVAVIADEPADESRGLWRVRIAGANGADRCRLEGLGEVIWTEEGADASSTPISGESFRFLFRPAPSTTMESFERALGACRGGVEVLCLGRRMDLVKQAGSPARLEATYRVSSWTGPLAIGHTRMSTESRIDLSHSQPFWAHGVPDLATVHNGHVTNYHLLRRRYEQQGVLFYTDNDSEVIGVYLRDRMKTGRSLAEAMADSIDDLDGAFNYLVASPEGLGIVRDRYGFKPLMLAESPGFVAVATEEIALRLALPGDYRVFEPPTGQALFFPAAGTASSVATPAARAGHGQTVIPPVTA